MRELGDAKSRLEAKEITAQNAVELREIEYEQMQSDFKALTPELEEIGREFWTSHVPIRLVDIFREFRAVIEDKESIQMTEAVGYHYEDGFPQHIVYRDPAGIRRDEFSHEFYKKNVVELWRDGKLRQVPLRSVSLTYSHSNRIGDSETVNKVSFEVTGDNKVLWSAGGGKKYAISGDGIRWVDSQGTTGISDSHLDELVELMIPILEHRAYRQEISHSLPPMDDDHGIGPI